MFHTFEGFEIPAGSTVSRGRNERQQSVGRRVTTLRACTSCRHRKIKCDGEKPCEACRWYKKADLCHYSDPRPSRRHVEKLSTTLDEYRSVLEKLFPHTAPETLVNLPRDRLLELMGKGGTQIHVHAPHPASPATSASVETHVSPVSNDEHNLESLQTMPDDGAEARSLSNSESANGISDDVNALSLSAKQSSSYLGVSSINAVLKVIVWLDPGSISYFSRTPAVRVRRESALDLSAPETQPWQVQVPQQPITPPHPQVQVTDMQLLDAYFTYVQPFIPMLDEQSFRETYLLGQRKDDRWLALLNIVFAMGSIAACPSDDTSHATFFQRCRGFMTLDCLGSSHMETIQALGLMGGYYLHYVSQPNLAYSLMGAALRMAAALGLHKEFTETQDVSSKQRPPSVELRRRVWWSLFCLDTWGGMTLGRPSMGRFGPTITVKLPNHGETGNVLDILPLLENVRFCKIATQIQEVLAVAPLTRYQDITHFDSQLLEWYDNLPYLLKDHQPCPESITIARTVMKWRYSNQRMLLYRPTLLSYALRRVPYIALRSEERSAIEKCRDIAEETIRDISSMAQSHQMSGWNAVWLIFQATMVPLLGLYMNDSTNNDPRAAMESCQAQVETTMLLLARLQPWSPTAKRTLDAVSRIFEASKRGPDMVSDTGLASGECPTSREGQAPGLVPGILPSQLEYSRGVMGTGENGFVDPLAPPFIDDTAGQHLWDFLSWSDNSLWPGVTELDCSVDEALLVPEEKMKFGNSAIFGNSMGESAYYVNSSLPFY
ncbi:hypothetical protein FE257_000112 [Aspergillus nanangensis]|uniref:Zn(2)-C6 fungal-type domain-containing protein n=1 Tax=Aspergillus nanangensis TaxID=2582783 RepID=A0AAD4GZX9_ASPNN|nr:hypothetical protein FE257_000112 [Aspergillus nanangensis]